VLPHNNISALISKADFVPGSSSARFTQLNQERNEHLRFCTQARTLDRVRQKDSQQHIVAGSINNGGHSAMESNAMVLYVDNNPRSRRLLAHLLEECGFAVVARGDPAEALELCRTQSFDLALVDYEMPLMTGAQLAKRIKSVHPDLPVVMISGCTALPPSELLSVDAHFGSRTSLDDLFDTMKMLIHTKPIAAANVPEGLSWVDST
jgi:CheY-like chemotaxis protein